MFHIVNNANRKHFEPQLEAMHRARACIFAARPHGGPDAIAGAGDRDAYDDDEALYLIRLDSFGEIICSCRLRPTARGSMIGAYFGQALDEAVDPGAWEFSQYYTRDDAVGPARYKMRAEMRLAIIAAALDAGIGCIVSVIETEYWPAIEQSGWTVRPLGPPVSFAPGAEAIVYRVSVRPEDLAAIHRRLAEELRASLGDGDGVGAEADEAVALAGSLGPVALNLVNSLARKIAVVEENEGFEAALALVESLERAVRDGRLN